MRIISRYILRLTLAPIFGTVLVVLIALMLERLLRLLDLTVSSNASVFIIFRLLFNLIPHYMGLALPAAFFVGLLLTFTRLSHDGELDALGASGIGLHRIMLPVMALALVLCAVGALLFGVLQPNSRYAYRALIYAARHASISAAFREGAFVKVDNLTFMAEKVMERGEGLSKVFVHERRRDGKSITTTAQYGALMEARAGADDLRPILHLENGTRVTIGPDGTVLGVLTFKEFNWPVGKAAGNVSYRARGKDRRELTLGELWRSRSGSGVRAVVTGEINRHEIRAELHGRLVRIISILVLPLFAIPLGLASRRAQRSYGVVVGMLILMAYHEVLVVAETLARFGRLPAEIALWVPFALFLGFSSFLFYRASFRVKADPLVWLVETAEDSVKRLRSSFARWKWQS